MELEKTETPATTIYYGIGKFNVAAGEYLQIRRGDPVNPIIELQEQVPAGKTWEVHLVVSVKEG